ncbi:hypothetical protein GBAR_LOCUS18048 [Geodia barretti]|uniref:Uncharacterized protein n=2 Tax=Geodia barretti TaxID=519541 RepID=A0AA35SL28_GEOBA|nr:hypothetical protein GBAR_LOCUS18048 [Geodia barretti]
MRALCYIYKSESKCSVWCRGRVLGADFPVSLIGFQRDLISCCIELLITIDHLIELFLVPRTLSTTLCSPPSQCVHPVGS